MPLGILVIPKEPLIRLGEKIEENPRLSLERLGFSSQDLSEVHFTGNYLGRSSHVHW